MPQLQWRQDEGAIAFRCGSQQRRSHSLARHVRTTGALLLPRRQGRSRRRMPARRPNRSRRHSWSPGEFGLNEVGDEAA